MLDKSFPGQRLKLFLAEWGVPSGFKDKDLGYGLKQKEANLWINAGFRLARTFKRIYSLGWVHLFDTAGTRPGLLTRERRAETELRRSTRQGSGNGRATGSTSTEP